MEWIDFRSDTVTLPTPGMREAMAAAVVGDDVYGEDPTVNALEQLAARMVGKEAGLFVASGTMGNLVAILSHAQRGDEAIVGIDAHSYCFEAGGMASLGGVIPRPLPTDAQGKMDLGEIEAAVRSDNVHYPKSRLILVENSYGNRQGFPLPVSYFASVREIARRHGLSVHMDGARLFNAAVALGVTADEIVRQVDSVSFCLSKGLSAPVGSILCGSAEFIHAARRIRKSLGGGMRQAGILAAAGMIALNEMVDRLAEDHTNARQLAHGLAEVDGIGVDPDSVKTNMVFFSLRDDIPLSGEALVHRLKEQSGILTSTFSGPRHFRAVTHQGIGPAQVAALVAAIAGILQSEIGGGYGQPDWSHN